MSPPGHGKGRPSTRAAVPNSTRSQTKDNQRRIVRVNAGRVSTTVRSTSPELGPAILATVPTHAREKIEDGHWVIGASAADELLRKLAADGWVVIRWPAFYDAGGA